MSLSARLPRLADKIAAKAIEAGEVEKPKKDKKVVTKKK
jgi:hypothetical protein